MKLADPLTLKSNLGRAIKDNFSKIIKAALEENATPLTPRKTSEIDQMARTPESPRATYPDSGESPKPTGLTPRKEKPSKS